MCFHKQTVGSIPETKLLTSRKRIGTSASPGAVAAGTRYCVCTVIRAGREQKITAVTLLLASFLRLTAESNKAKPPGRARGEKDSGKWKTGRWELEEIRALMKPWDSKFHISLHSLDPRILWYFHDYHV